MKKTTLTILLILILVLVFVNARCENDAEVASRNLSIAADNFEVYRRVVFYNGITDEYILMVEGYCSIHVDTIDNQLELTVKTGKDERGRVTFFKHYLGLSDNVTYFAEQLDGKNVSTQQYRVIFKPATIIPDIEFK